jgi:two-component system response regulator HydG
MNKILIIDDDRDICLLLSKYLAKNNFEVEYATNGLDGLDKVRNDKFDLILQDYKLPDVGGVELLQKIKILSSDSRVIIITGYSDVRTAVLTLKHGAIDYVTKPLFPDEILMTIKAALDKPASPTKTNAAVSGKTTRSSERKFVFGPSHQTEVLQKHINLIAPTDMSVIITGETGTGKEYVANAIHLNSKRKNKPFVAIDCGALPKELAGSELFGHIKGAFTGAVNDKKGSFEVADGGTLFLDEIGNLSYENQIKLLRVLQERKIKRLGSTKDVEIDVRIITASNVDLKEMVKEGKFREDIYHRLNEFKIEIRPLRERQDDIMSYAWFFLEESNEVLEKNVTGFTDSVKERLINYVWHGNLRELRNVVKRAVLLAQGDKVTIECLPSEIINPDYQGSDHMADVRKENGANLKAVSESAEKNAIIEVLEKTGFNKTRAAQILKIDRKTLYNKLRAYNIQL